MLENQPGSGSACGISRVNPVSKQPILVKKGRFGPYVTDGETNVSIPKAIDPASVTHEDAIEMLQKKREKPSRKRGKKS